MKKEIWGFYPPPVGGISIYCKRLIEKLNAKETGIVMRNFAGSRSGCDYVVDVKIRILEFLKLLFVPKRLIHAQFTNFYMLMLLNFCGWRHEIVITLHNRRLVMLDGWKRRIVCRLLKRVRYIIYNDPAYTPLLSEKFSIDVSKVVILPTYIPPADNEMKGLTHDIKGLVARHEYTLSANANRIIKNEVFGDLYGIDQLIGLMDRLVNGQKLNAGMLFCISEVFNQDYFDECKKRIDSLGLAGYFHFIVQSPANGFEVWAATDLFLRPTMSDMEGVSVKEALQSGTPVVASDVCTRPKEAVLYEAGNVDSLYEKVLPLLLGKERVSYVPDVDVVNEILSLYSNVDF